MRLKIYQENAIDELLAKAKQLLGYSGGKKLVFKAPTGSGKTIMMAEFLKQLVDDREVKQSLGFIWAAPHKLHTQSKDKLEKYFENSRALECKFFEDLNDRQISENEILFFNWESINKTNATYIRDNEQEFNLSKVLEKTREQGTKIILIIDESHFFAGAKDDKEKQAANKLRNDINADLTIEVSATPILRGDFEVDVLLDDVKKEAMVKKAVIINDGFDKLIKNRKIHTEKLSDKKIQDSEELVIGEAMKKRDELVKAYKKEGVAINPLVAIQLPRRIGQTEDRMREKIESILKNKYKITTEKGNNKLAIWLSGEYTNKDDIERIDSGVEVLIFKEAIAYGWDCPRAQILVLFREWHSPVFSIQTVGRIMRMPEPDKGCYYKSEVLNYGYAYTNLDNIEIKEDIDRGYLSIYKSKRRADYRPINLLSCYPKRHREKTRLAPLFQEIFLKEAKNYELKKKIDIKAKKIDLKIISDYMAEDIDTLSGANIVGDQAIDISGFDLQKLLDYFVRNCLKNGSVSLYPEDRSVGRVKELIYKFFEHDLKMWYGDNNSVWEEIVQIVLSDKNSQHIFNVLDKAKEKYQAEVMVRESEMMSIENWNIPEALSYGSEYAKIDTKKSIMQPFLSDGKWKTETAFVEFLEKSKAVDWWFKNGDRDATFFAVPYQNGEQKPFYIDFIVKLKDGRIGLFDTKAGITKEVAGPKIDGLYEYIKKENKKDKKLFGGIVTNTDRNYRGRWIYFDKPCKNLKKDNFSNWQDLIL